MDNKRIKSSSNNDTSSNTTITENNNNKPIFVLVGITTLDVILQIPEEIQPDMKTRATSQINTVGGNATNSAVVLSKLLDTSESDTTKDIGDDTSSSTGGDVSVEKLTNTSLKNNVFLISQMPSRNDPQTKQVLDYLHDDTSVNTSLLCYKRDEHNNSKFTLPISYVISASSTGSRTIINYRGNNHHDNSTPELLCEEFERALNTLLRSVYVTSRSKSAPIIFHFEGRNVPQVSLMMKLLEQHEQANRFHITLELEKKRGDGFMDERNLLSFCPSVVIFSKQWILERYPSFVNVESTLIQTLIQQRWLFANNNGIENNRIDVKRPITFLFTMGNFGALLIDIPAGNLNLPLTSSTITTPSQVVPPHTLNHADLVDTNGAGDAFLAGFLHGKYSKKLADSFHSVVWAHIVAAGKIKIKGFKAIDVGRCEELLAAQ
jgi:sugar/nucleoside kinase (ribokinase family)